MFKTPTVTLLSWMTQNLNNLSRDPWWKPLWILSLPLWEILQSDLTSTLHMTSVAKILSPKTPSLHPLRKIYLPMISSNGIRKTSGVEWYDYIFLDLWFIVLKAYRACRCTHGIRASCGWVEGGGALCRMWTCNFSALGISCVWLAQMASILCIHAGFDCWGCYSEFH